MRNPEPDESPLSPLQRQIDSALWAGAQRPWMTVGLTALVVALHVAAGVQMWLAHKVHLIGVLLEPRDLPTLVSMGAMRGLLVSGGEYWRLLSCVLLHGDGAHILLNAVALFGVGRLCESVYGPARLLFLFMTSGLCGSLLSWAGGNASSVGASGGVFGLMGAAVVFGFRFQKTLPPTQVGELFKDLVPWVVLNLFIGAVVPFIDNLAHVGGLVGGALGALAINNRVIPNRETTRAGTVVTGAVGGAFLAVAILGVAGVL
jgi:rhomboid protease GluP